MMRPRLTMSTLAMLAVCTAALATSCSDSHPKAQVGGETHFLSACIDGECGDGLECVCGVCTAPCGSRLDCAQYDEAATCVSLEVSSALCDGVPSAGRVCDVRCDESSECSGLGDGFECTAERCRPEEIAETIADAGDVARDAGQDGAVDGAISALTDPLVLLVIDTSGSMERKAQCKCTTASCSECLPRCSGADSEKNRWAELLEALTGTFDDFSCESITRTGGYDGAYPIPYHRPQGTQRDDGVLQDFAGRVRFGLATFDGVSSYDQDQQRSVEEFSIARSMGMEGMWSYPPDDAWTEIGSGAAAYQIYRYPGCPHPYVMNTGIRGRDAEEGALLANLGGEPQAATVDAVARSLLATRPFGGTPIAAALDDVRALFEHDPWMEAERNATDHQRHVVLITDGRPDDDYRNVNCDCNEPDSGKTCAPYLSPTEQASDMRCAYPTSAQAARALRAGGVVDALHVIGLAVEDDGVATDTLRQIAREARGRVQFADTAEELRVALTRVLQVILSEPQRQPTFGDSCTSGDYVYADGARWPERCATCECVGGLIQCTGTGDCRLCERDWDCEEGEYCEPHGYCTDAASVACDKPTNFDAFCGESGLTYDDPCTARSPIRHGGACEETACPWLSAEVQHGAPAPSSGPCEACTCFEGVIECDDICGPPCSSDLQCRDDEVCALPIDQCAASEEPTGQCKRVPVHCSGMIDDDSAYCGCDGNFYSECELLLNRQSEASTAVCETN